MQEEKCIRLNIVIKPSSKISDEVIKLSQKLAKEHAHEFVLDGENLYPHITVYSPLYPEKNFEKVVGEVRELVKDFEPIDLKASGVKAGQRYIGIEYEYTSKIRRFHEAVVKKFNPLREGNYNSKYDTSDYKMKMSEEKKENIAKYGYPNAMSLYHPHMTIIRLKNEKEVEKVVNEIDWQPYSFQADSIAVYKMGDHGTCTELVKEFKLK